MLRIVVEIMRWYIIKSLSNLYLFQSFCADTPKRPGFLRKLGLCSIVGDTIFQDEINVVQELFPIVVLVGFNFLGNRF